MKTTQHVIYMVLVGVAVGLHKPPWMYSIGISVYIKLQLCRSTMVPRWTVAAITHMKNKKDWMPSFHFSLPWGCFLNRSESWRSILFIFPMDYDRLNYRWSLVYLLQSLYEYRFIIWKEKGSFIFGYASTYGGVRYHLNSGVTYYICTHYM